MGEEEAGDELVDNEFRMAMEGAKPSAVSHGDDIATLLKKMTSAMEAGAWQSTAATTFGAELDGRSQALRTAGHSVGPAFQDRIGEEPEKVKPSDYRAHYFMVRHQMQRSGLTP